MYLNTAISEVCLVDSGHRSRGTLTLPRAALGDDLGFPHIVRVERTPQIHTSHAWACHIGRKDIRPQ